VYEFFGGIWEGIKGVILSFIGWIGPAIELIIAPFRKVAEAVGGVLDGIEGFFRGLMGESDAAGDKVGENLARLYRGNTRSVRLRRIWFRSLKRQSPMY
jgi:hypothetical protein